MSVINNIMKNMGKSHFWTLKELKHSRKVKICHCLIYYSKYQIGSEICFSKTDNRLTATKEIGCGGSYVDAKLNSCVPRAITVVASPWVRNCSVVLLHIFLIPKKRQNRTGEEIEKIYIHI